MEKVYVVTIGAFSERRIAGIFSTEEKAKETCAELEKTRPQEPVFLREYPLDIALGQLCNFEIECVNGEWRELSRDEVREEYYDSVLKTRWGTYEIYARSFEEAVERAKKYEGMS